jgi:hypothetical protein
MNLCLLLICTALMLAIRFAGAQTSWFEIVAPNNLQFVDGNSGSWVPWGAGPGRYQEVFAASEFSALAGVGGGWIRNLSFRLDAADVGDFQRTVRDVQINLSTTSRGPDGLSAVFAENVGPDERVVFTGNATLIMNRGPGPPASMPFGSPIFISPFLYDPSQGNLLLDVWIFSQSPVLLPSKLDSSRVTGDAISSVGAPVNSASGLVDTEGLVVRFFVEPVPEPSMVALLCVGAGFGIAVWRTRRKEAAHVTP